MNGHYDTPPNDANYNSDSSPEYLEGLFEEAQLALERHHQSKDVIEGQGPNGKYVTLSMPSERTPLEALSEPGKPILFTVSEYHESADSAPDVILSCLCQMGRVIQDQSLLVRRLNMSEGENAVFVMVALDSIYIQESGSSPSLLHQSQPIYDPDDASGQIDRARFFLRELRRYEEPGSGQR